MTNSGGIDEYFEAMSSPATCMELPPAATTYALADPALAVATGERYKVKILTPVETAELLPLTRGLGATIPPESLMRDSRSGNIMLIYPDGSSNVCRLER